MPEESYPEIGVSDQRQLLGEEEEVRPPFHQRHRWCLGLTILFLFIVIGHVLAIYFIYFNCSIYTNCAQIKVMGLNTWGMPESLGSKYKTERMKAIADEVRKGHYDLYLLSELWMEGDHNTVAAAVPKGYYITGLRELALPTCDGRVGPEFCSGLAVISKIPVVSTHFESYTYHGDAAKMFIDGEYLARKGVGKVSMKLLDNISMDVFITHTAADPDPSHGYNNSYYRVRQVRELMDTYVTKSEADVVLLGGDFNAGPNMAKGEPYQMIKEFMENSAAEFFYKLNQWLNPEYATYGNKRNTFSAMYSPIIYDYIFYRTNSKRVAVWTNWFELPFFQLLLPKRQRISFSDHEAVTATIHVWKHKY